MNMFFKSTAILALLYFLMSMAVQYNDPDPLFWMGIYGIIFAATFLFLLEKLPMFVPLLIATGCVAGGIMSWPEVFEGVQRTMGDNINVEEGREALGLFISAALMLVLSLGIFLSSDMPYE